MTTPQPDIADILDRAADLIAAPGAWTQKLAISRGDGEGCGWGDPRASCYCLYGAVRVSAGIYNGDLFDSAFDVVGQVLDTPIEWNDTRGRTQDEVVSKLREAASKARSEQGA